MTPKEAKELIPPLEAYSRGETIQCKMLDGKWKDLSVIGCIYGSDKLRVKPKPFIKEFWVATWLNEKNDLVCVTYQHHYSEDLIYELHADKKNFELRKETRTFHEDERVSHKRPVKFEELREGDVFEDENNGEICIKIPYVQLGWNVFSFDKNAYRYYRNGSSRVILKPNATLVLE